MGTFNAESAQLPGVTGRILQGQSSTHTVPVEIILLCSETSEERMKLSSLQLRFKLHRVCRSVRTSMAGQIDCNGSKALYQVGDEMARSEERRVGKEGGGRGGREGAENTDGKR